MTSRKLLLVILDGWGLSPNPAVSAIDQASKPFFDSLWSRYIHATLNTTGLAVGLPAGQMGNSEVGHMNIGAGRVVYQELVRIGEAVRTGEIAHTEEIGRMKAYLHEHPKARLHLMGLVSDGGVHSHIDHLLALIVLFGDEFAGRVYVQAFTDGRDCDPKSAPGFLARTMETCQAHGVALATIIGRYYGMDRDKRWERVQLAYNGLVSGKGKAIESTPEAVEAALQESYKEGVTDEFIKPIILQKEGKPVASLEEGDAVLVFNFRTDRGRQITQVLTQTDMPEHGMHTIQLHYSTMTRYEEHYKNVGVVFEKDNLVNTLGETLSRAGKRQIRIAETEKYPHVTFFFNGGREEPFEGEERIMCASPKVATYDLQPEMSAPEITAAIIPRIQTGEADFICLNYANTDMVGHTGVFEAAKAACHAVDACLAQLVPAALAAGYTCWIIADHGNSDNEINPDGSPNTQHSTNPVPSLLVGPEFLQGGQTHLKDGKLGDLGGSILYLLGIPAPPEFKGEVLVEGV